MKMFCMVIFCRSLLHEDQLLHQLTDVLQEIAKSDEQLFALVQQPLYTSVILLLQVKSNGSYFSIFYSKHPYELRSLIFVNKSVIKNMNFCADHVSYLFLICREWARIFK